MDNTLSKQILLSVLGLAILIVAIVGVSYAIFVDPVSVNTVYLKYDSVDNEISLMNTLPISDVEGINLNNSFSSFEFSTVANVDANTVVDYEIILEKIESENNTLHNNEVKVYLEKFVDGNYVSVSGYPNYFVSALDSNSTLLNDYMILYKGSFSNNTSEVGQFIETFRLKFWVDKDTVIDSYEKVFKASVKVNYN